MTHKDLLSKKPSSWHSSLSLRIENRGPQAEYQAFCTKEQHDEGYSAK